jgi:integrating conjugative element protein (TIGR03757 family)
MKPSRFVMSLGVCCIWGSVWAIAAHAQTLQYTPSSVTQTESGAAPALRVHVEVFANTGTPLQNTQQAVVYVLDTLGHLEQTLSHDLPKEPEAAMAMVQARLAQLTASDKTRMNRAVEGRMRAQSYGLTQLPAMVINGRAVVYGVADVFEAARRYEAGQAVPVRARAQRGTP